jgi:cold shock CspA family protein
MRVPLEITFRDAVKSDEIVNLIESKAAGLDKICDNLISCRVAVEKPHENRRSRDSYRVRISMRIPPGRELVVKREPADSSLTEPLTTVIREAFETARRRLLKLLEQQQGVIKTHPQQQTIAYVTKLFRDKGYGFIETFEGREIYFHRNSVLHDDFSRLDIGTGVRYVATEGDDGPQASTIQIVDKPGANRVVENTELV